MCLSLISAPRQTRGETFASSICKYLVETQLLRGSEKPSVGCGGCCQSGCELCLVLIRLLTGSMNRALHPLPQRMTEQRCYRRSPVEYQGLQPIRWRFSARRNSPQFAWLMIVGSKYAHFL